NRVLEVEMLREGREVVGVVVRVMSIRTLARPSMPAAVMGDDPIAMVQEEQDLGVPVVGRQGPSMREDEGLAGAPVLVENGRAVGGDDLGHSGVLLVKGLDRLSNLLGRSWASGHIAAIALWYHAL